MTITNEQIEAIRGRPSDINASTLYVFVYELLQAIADRDANLEEAITTATLQLQEACDIRERENASLTRQLASVTAERDAIKRTRAQEEQYDHMCYELQEARKTIDELRKPVAVERNATVESIRIGWADGVNELEKQPDLYIGRDYRDIRLMLQEYDTLARDNARWVNARDVWTAEMAAKVAEIDRLQADAKRRYSDHIQLGCKMLGINQKFIKSMTANDLQKLTLANMQAIIEAKEHIEDDLRAELAGWTETYDRANAGLAEREEIIERQRSELQGLREALSVAYDLMSTSVPTSCGACGTPNASCDMDCMEAAAIGTELSKWSRLLSTSALAASPAPVELSKDGIDLYAYIPMPAPVESERERELREALEGIVEIIDKAGLLNLSNGVQFGQTSWYVKASDHLEYARKVLASTALAMPPANQLAPSGMDCDTRQPGGHVTGNDVAVTGSSPVCAAIAMPQQKDAEGCDHQIGRWMTTEGFCTNCKQQIETAKESGNG